MRPPRLCRAVGGAGGLEPVGRLVALGPKAAVPGSHPELEVQLLGSVGDPVVVAPARGRAEPPGQRPTAQGCQRWVGLQGSSSSLLGGSWPELSPRCGRARLLALSRLPSPLHGSLTPTHLEFGCRWVFPCEVALL